MKALAHPIEQRLLISSMSGEIRVQRKEIGAMRSPSRVISFLYSLELAKEAHRNWSWLQRFFKPSYLGIYLSSDFLRHNCGCVLGLFLVLVLFKIPSILPV